MGYVELEQLAAMNAAIDEAADAAGRPPGAVRRLLNINGAFDHGAGFLQGSPRDWAEQLAELTLSSGMSTYLLSVSSEDDLRRFAEEVAPDVHERVMVQRSSVTREKRPSPVAVSGNDDPGVPPFAAAATPYDGHRMSDEHLWDESTRPTGPVADPARQYTPDQQAAGDT